MILVLVKYWRVNLEISALIESILKSKSITDFLEKRGIFPDKQNGDKIYYKCPIHQDEDPSFIVFTGGEYQTYKCFGCHSGNNIINLVCDMNKISLGQSISYLSQELGITFDNQFEFSKKDIEIYIEKEYPSINKIEQIYFSINKLCYDFLKKINFEEDEIIFCENVLKKIDYLVKTKNVRILNDLYFFLSDIGFPSKCKRYFLKKKREENNGRRN